MVYVTLRDADPSTLAPLAKIHGPKRPPPATEDVRRTDDPVVGRISPKAEAVPLRGEGAQLKLYKTTQGAIMRADHVVRDFLEDSHKEIGEIVKGASGPTSPVGLLNRTNPEIDLVRLGGLINRAELFLDAHSAARFDGLAPSLIVRNVSSEGLKLFEHLKLTLDELSRNGRIPESARSMALEQLVELRGSLRSLVHHFDSRMLQVFSAMHGAGEGTESESDAGDDGPTRAA
jgi:hypothetical protein